MPRNSRARTGLTRKSIQGGALLLFFEKGYHATGIREIAATVGIQVATLYNHFPSKQEILASILVERTTEQNEHLESKLERAGADPLDRLKVFIGLKVHEQENRMAERVSDRELRSLEASHREKVVELRDRQDRILDEILENGYRHGYWRKPGNITRLLVFQSVYITPWYREDGPLRLNEISDLCTDYILRALGYTERLSA